jgi:hypothetical protein
MDLMHRQWEAYPRYHRARANLIIHIFAVPLFLIGNIGIAVTFIEQSPGIAIVSVVFVALSMILQRFGHGLEKLPSEPFTSPGNAVSRILMEQWVTFPRFLVSGAWLRALLHDPPQ